MVNEFSNEDMGENNPEPSGHGHVCDMCGAQWDCFDVDCQPGLTTCDDCRRIQTKDRPDFEVINQGTICLLQPMTVAAREWLAENIHVESWQMMGDAVAIEPRYMAPILAGIDEEGLRYTSI